MIARAFANAISVRIMAPLRFCNCRVTTAISLSPTTKSYSRNSFHRSAARMCRDRKLVGAFGAVFLKVGENAFVGQIEFS